MAQIYKNPLDQANAIAPETTRSKWNRYFKHIGDGNPRTVDKYNALIGEIESELPFENEEQHQKWLDLGSNWNGEDEWPTLTETLLKTAERYDLDPSHIKELKNRYRGKDYAEAINRLKGGEAYGDILNGLVTYEEPKRDFTGYKSGEYYQDGGKIIHHDD
jgi:hypothetical protein